MLVRVLRQGFYRGSRRRVGTEFEMPTATRENMPRWVQPADAPKQVVKSEEEKALGAARAMAGPKRAGVAALRDAQGMSLDISEAMVEQGLSAEQRRQEEIDKFNTDELV